MDRREELGKCLEKMRGWGGLTADLLAAVFINEEAASRAFQTISTKARQTVSGRGVVVVYGTLAHGVPALNVAGIICPLLDTQTNIRWLGDTSVEGLKGGPILRVEDQNLDQFGWPSSLLTVFDFVVVQPASATASASSQQARTTPVVPPATAAPAKHESDHPKITAVTQTCGKCGRPVDTSPPTPDTTPERLATTALYCARCDDIVCITCGTSKMEKAGAIPCGKCGGPAQPIDDSHHPSWYARGRPTSRNAPQRPKPAGTSLLPALTRDLTQVNIQSHSDSTVLRENEFDRVIRILCRQVRRNPVLVGESGIVTGSVIEELAIRIVDGGLPSLLQRTKLLALDVPSLVAGSTDRADFKHRLGCIAREADDLKDVILLIEALPALFLQPDSEANSAGVLDVLKESLSVDSLRCIVTVPRAETAELICTDPCVGRYFQEVQVSPATAEECTRLLYRSKDQYERFHALAYDDDAVETAVALAGHKASKGSLLEDALRLLDEAGSCAKLRLSLRPDEILAAQARLKVIEHRMENAIRNHEFEKARSYTDDGRKEREILSQLEQQYQIDDTVIGRVGPKDVEEASAFSNRVLAT